MLLLSKLRLSPEANSSIRLVSELAISGYLSDISYYNSFIFLLIYQVSYRLKSISSSSVNISLKF